jgi:homoserine O-acetyltransferase
VLGVQHLRAVVGISLGGMQAFQWAVTHPDRLDKAVAIVGTPRASPGDRRRWQAWIEDVRRPSGDKATVEPNNYTRQGQAIVAFDVAARFGGSLAQAAAAARGKMLVVVSPKDEVLDPAAALEFARLAGAEVLELDGRCGHGAPSCESGVLEPAVGRFLAR